MLGGHGREDHHQRGHLLAAPGAEALLLLGRLEVAQRLPPLAHGQAGGLDVVLEQVGAHGVARLVQGHRPGLLGHVLDALRGPGLDGGHRLHQVAAAEAQSPLGVRVGEGHRAHLLDHGR